MLSGPPTHPELLFKTKPVTERDVENKLASRATEQVVQGGLGIIHDYGFFLKNGKRYVYGPEVLYLILGFTLVIKDHTITPDVTSSNKRSSYKMSHSYTLDGKRYEPPDFYNSQDSNHSVPLSTIITKKYHDSEGAYFMLHNIYRPMIDATVLRVCKAISVQGTKMLRLNYSRNPDGYFLMAIHAIETQVPTYDLEDYFYHDHSIRFLHIIGPAKAAMIKRLHFHGRIVTHKCKGPERALDCEDDLAIIGFKALDELLRTLKTVRRLEIYQLKEAEPIYNIVEPGSIKIIHTFPELHQRANKWEHEEIERQKTLMTLDTPPQRGEKP
ncbi:hypothetical protein BCON_0813g00030 [Botryotinia convoluta]|uniref:Uncharacterized protein n=1 Tax=Botryotinia convoluta TaxID=54673 RepID=A0A4Z1HAT7_9HELO|nr:hypothetical protein BCON_0813g00030 [Botryotinia convoluta]